MTVCHVCGIPTDAGFFDESRVVGVPEDVGAEVVLARYELPRNYCGLLVYFAQYTDLYAKDPRFVETPDLEWEIRINGYPRDPYLTFDRIINPWGLHGFPMNLRLDEGSVLEFAVRRTPGLGVLRDSASGGAAMAAVGPGRPVPATKPRRRPSHPRGRVSRVGGRLVGRYWYNTIYGGAPNPL